jgi:hypothetical protein
VIWILVGLGVVALVTVTTLSNRATCRKAFSAGYLSHERPNLAISETYKSYLVPMRPMDAAAFQKGLEYAASMPNLDVNSPQFANEFKRIYKTGVLTKEGTQIRQMGNDAEAQRFQQSLERMAPSDHT